MKTLQERLSYLDEVAGHFNTGNRSVRNGLCVYYHPEHGGCAIGIKIPDKDLCRKLDEFYTSFKVADSDVFNLLPLDMQEFSKDFLECVQRFHDKGNNWTKTGLSLAGKSEYDHIKAVHCS